MLNFYTMHQNWAFLLAPLPDCQALSSDAGFIRRDCQNITGTAGISPIVDLQMTLEDATYQICGNPSLTTDILGRYLTHYCVLPAYSGTGLLSILPDKAHLTADAGISTFDLVLISKHILGITPLENPFQLIAADENNSGSVTSFDILEIRKLLLGIKDTLAAGNWRYVPDYCFADSAFATEFSEDDDLNTAGLQLNPFDAVWTNPDETGGQSRTYSGGGAPPNATSWMDHVSIEPTAAAGQESRTWSFWAVKTGDVNCSANPSQTLPPDEPFVPVSHAAISANQVFTLQIRVFEDTPVSAWQLGVDFAEDSLEILQVLAGNSGEGFSEDNFGLTEAAQGKFRALNFSATGATTDLDNKTLFKVRVKALRPISNLSQRFRVKNSVLPKIFYAGDGSEIENPTLQLEVVSGLSMPGIPGSGSHPSATTAADAYQLSVYPLPFRDLVRFDFDLAADAEVCLALYDSRGCLMAKMQENRTAGPNTLTIEALGGQPAGFYFYVFEAGQGRQFGKLVKN